MEGLNLDLGFDACVEGKDPVRDGPALGGG